MSRFRQILQALGKSGIAFVITSLLCVIFNMAGRDGLTALCIVALIPLGIIVIVRAFRWLRRHTLWSVSHRLLFVYGLFGVLPMFLLFVLVGLGAWALMNELAIYLASSELDRRLQSVNGAAQALERIPPANRPYVAPEMVKAFSHALPGVAFYVTDSTGTRHYPSDAPDLRIPNGWGNTTGLVVINRRFYGWSHLVDSTGQICVVAPFTDQVIENLVPHLGVIALVETHRARNPGEFGAPAASGSVKVRQSGTPDNPDFHLEPGSGRAGRLPPPMNRFDVPVLLPSARAHYHLEDPGKQYEGLLWVYSRPSAVLGTLFSGPEVIRGFLYDALVAIAILFLVVELIALTIGVSLSRRITRSINQIYEGTRQVIHGDFQHRIPVSDTPDQLGELASSFNQMTGNLQRLMEVEKEKERLQTELEIAREVQAQLYPKEAPPSCGLKLTVRCDPARMVSGDYYDYQEIGPGKLAFAIGDVAGKGISAALLMATLQAALRAQIGHYAPANPNECGIIEVDTADLVSRLNRQLFAHTAPEKYATFFFGLFDEPTRTVTYTNAGHLSPLLFRNGDVVSLNVNGLVVGAFSFANYDESCIGMVPGDLLVCYTDGITEPENAYGEAFGEERLIELIHKHAHEPDQHIVDVVLDAVRAWTGTPELQDDMTLLLAREVERA